MPSPLDAGPAWLSRGPQLTEVAAAEDPDECKWEDDWLAGLTFLRYFVLGLIVLWRVWRLFRGVLSGEPQGTEFNMIIDKTSGRKLGASLGGIVDQHYGEVLLIHAVTGGLFQRWNVIHPEQAVKPGDRIVEVNGIRNDVLLLEDECKKHQILELVVKCMPKEPGAEGGAESETHDLTRRIRSSPPWKGFLLAGFLFVLTEGVGLVIYFSVSAVMDNFAIFFVKGGGFSNTVKAVSLYSMAVVSFLPNVFLGIWLQGRWYDGQSLGRKALFVGFMTTVTVSFFVARMWLVYRCGGDGFASLVRSWMSVIPRWSRVALAVVIPPLVDGIQSIMLILTGQQGGKGAVLATPSVSIEMSRSTHGSFGPGA